MKLLLHKTEIIIIIKLKHDRKTLISNSKSFHNYRSEIQYKVRFGTSIQGQSFAAENRRAGVVGLPIQSPDAVVSITAATCVTIRSSGISIIKQLVDIDHEYVAIKH